MTASNFDTMTPLQRLIVERALALAQELEATAGSASTGQVIDRCESLLLGAGRDFLRRALEDTLQAQVEALEKKLGRQSLLDQRLLNRPEVGRRVLAESPAQRPCRLPAIQRASQQPPPRWVRWGKLLPIDRP